MFQCSSASRKFLKPALVVSSRVCTAFQCSSASRKFLKGLEPLQDAGSVVVSVLFSEPKIPQNRPLRCQMSTNASFSALQRAENSSKFRSKSEPRWKRSFSALQRAENSSNARELGAVRFNDGFSALQRAENSSNRSVNARAASVVWFQCSSASRKFLKTHSRSTRAPFSVFQCSSASRKFLKQPALRFVFRQRRVSVLFSEPKIPQKRPRASATPASPMFQCSSASRKFLKTSG